MNRTIEIEDDLQERVDGCCKEAMERCMDYLKENLDTYDEDEVYQNGLADDMHEIADSWVPIYTKEIDDLFYLYSSELEEAYENTGCYDQPPGNYKQVCIYFYLSEQLQEYWQDEITPLIEEYIEYRDKIESEDQNKEIRKALISKIEYLF